MAELTAQGIFDDTVRHLRSMKRPSMKGSQCAYRGNSGERCAAGLHLTDEECNLPEDRPGELPVDPEKLPRFGSTIDALADTDISSLDMLKLWPSRLAPFKSLIQGLQTVHDNLCLWEPGGMKATAAREALLNVADRHHLNIDLLNQEFST